MKRIILISLFVIATFIANSQTFSDLVEKVNESVVTIQVLEKKNLGIGNPSTYTAAEGMGSGVLVGEKKIYVLTAAHVVSNATKIQVVFTDGTSVGALNKRIDRTSDVALLQLDLAMTDIPAAKIGDSEKVRIGDEIFIIGNPLGLSHSVSRGIISGKHSEQNETNQNKAVEFFQTDAAINKGNSGGPMFNMQGEVVGIVSSILSFSGGFEGLGFAATSEIAKEILSQKGRIWFGTDVMSASAELCKIFNVPQDGALLVQSVTENSPAYFMGVKGGYVAMKIGETEFLAGGDFILQFDDIKLNSAENMEKFYEYLNTLEQGRQYKVKVYRGGEIKELTWRMQ
ncbi:MAG: trypsin-like peptidase domain-containing protein [Bacteroidota bacterium]